MAGACLPLSHQQACSDKRKQLWELQELSSLIWLIPWCSALGARIQQTCRRGGGAAAGQGAESGSPTGLGATEAVEEGSAAELGAGPCGGLAPQPRQADGASYGAADSNTRAETTCFWPRTGWQAKRSLVPLTERRAIGLHQRGKKVKLNRLCAFFLCAASYSLLI